MADINTFPAQGTATMLFCVMSRSYPRKSVKINKNLERIIKNKQI